MTVTRLSAVLIALSAAAALGNAAASAVGGQPAAPGTLALVGGRILTTPDAVPIDDGVVLVEKGRITAVGRRAAATIPAVERLIDCKGLVVTAGFQNSHVHFSDTRWMNATTESAETLAAQLRDMLVRYGFTTVVDTGSHFENTVALRQRIESGEIAGPRILTAGLPLYPPKGVPYYVRETVPPRPARAVAATRDGGGGHRDRSATDDRRREHREVVRGLVGDAGQGAADAAGDRDGGNGRSAPAEEARLRAPVDVLAHAVEDTRDTTPDQWVRMR
jgi:imidazolonepropionase-like amidohydrolase